MSADTNVTYYVVRKAGSIGEASAVVTELGPEWQALAAFSDLAEVRRYFLSQSAYRMTPAYRGHFARRVPRVPDQRDGYTVVLDGDVLHIPRWRPR